MRRIIGHIFFIIICMLVFEIETVKADTLFAGNGTKESPYEINTVTDFVLFADMVNAGNTFEGYYFVQNYNLDFSDVERLKPIGNIVDNTYFAGNYNGLGHFISNIEIDEMNEAALFGVLAGRIENLGIESGTIRGTCAAGFAVRTQGNDALILNCYNKATIIGARASGIADSFSGNIINCWNVGDCISNSNVESNISAYWIKQIMYCYSVDSIAVEQQMCDNVNYTEVIENSEIRNEEFVDLLNENLRECIRFGILDFEDAVFWDLHNGECVYGCEEGIAKENSLFSKYSKFRKEQSGAKDNPITIASIEELALLRLAVDMGINYDGIYFKQTADIDMASTEKWNAIGDVETHKEFAGFYDGNGKTISNLKIKGDEYAGFIEYLSGTICNMQFSNIDMQADKVGGIACVAYKEPLIYNCSVTGTISGKTGGGGVVYDFAGGTVRNVWTMISPVGNVYGICSHSAELLEDCYSNIEVWNSADEQAQYIKFVRGDVGSKLQREVMCSETFCNRVNKSLTRNSYIPLENIGVWEFDEIENQLSFCESTAKTILIWLRFHLEVVALVVLCVIAIINACVFKKRETDISTNRNGVIDFLRIIFCINIMLLHWGQFLGEEELFAQCGYIGVSFFFMVSGYYLVDYIRKKEIEDAQSINLVDETCTYVYKKIKKIFPYFIVAALISIIAVSIFLYVNNEQTINNIGMFIFEILMLQMAGFPAYAIMGTEWYLSALFIVLMMLYPIVRKYRRLYTHMIGPVAVVLILGWIAHEYGNLTSTAGWNGICYEGVMKAFALVSAGGICYEVSEAIARKYKNQKCFKYMWTILEVGIWGGVCCGIIWFKKYTFWDFILASMIFMGLCISFSKVSDLNKYFKGAVPEIAAKLSIPLFLCHGYLLHILPRFVKGMDKWHGLCIFMVCSMITALVDMAVVNIIRKIRATFIKG